MAIAKQVIVLAGKNMNRPSPFVRWEIHVALLKNLPIVVVNLNDQRAYDSDRCPPILRDAYAVHVAFKKEIIQHALDYFPAEHTGHDSSAAGPLHYDNGIYKKLGL